MATHRGLSVLMSEMRYRIQDVCKKSGLSRSSVSELYHDKMRTTDHETLNRLFGCNMGELREYNVAD